jgi:hypothetical protein
VLVHGALPRFGVEELAARCKDLVLLVAQDPLPGDLLRVFLAYVGDRLAEALGEPPDICIGDPRSRVRAAVGGTLGAVVAGRARTLEYLTRGSRLRRRLSIPSSPSAPADAMIGDH